MLDKDNLRLATREVISFGPVKKEAPMVKSVVLTTGREFASIKSAGDHFSQILKAQQVGAEFSGADADDLHALFLGYCEKTSWHLPSPPVAFYPTWDKRPGSSTLCFGVRYEDDSKGNFSLPKALSSVAN